MTRREPQQSPERERLSSYVETSLARAFIALAERSDRSVSAELRQAIRSHLERASR
ncbi:MAG TPA: hypothetical protein VLV46_06570 [Gaiellaceae bacterium]|nr:hypothetical protein [Gaiellaceae bacterium]